METTDFIDRLRNDRPAFHAGGSRRWDSLPETLEFIQRSVSPGDRTIETGCGVSTIVFAAAGANHTTISPDSEEHARVREYGEGVGLSFERVTFARAFSDVYLPAANLVGQIDLAFIDGAHAFPFPIVDWHYVARALKVGGRLVLDDIPIPSIAILHKYMMSEPCWRRDAVLDNRTAAFSLVAPIAPEDWTLQRFNNRPDYSFLPLWPRATEVTTFELHRLRSAVGLRFPSLRRLRRASAPKSVQRPRT